MTEKEMVDQAIALVIDVKIIDAIKDLSTRTLDNDKALLSITQTLTEKVLRMAAQIEELEHQVKMLHLATHQKGTVN